MAGASCCQGEDSGFHSPRGRTMVGFRPQDRGDLQSEWAALAAELRGTGREACPKATTVTQAQEDGGSDPAEGRQHGL